MSSTHSIFSMHHWTADLMGLITALLNASPMLCSALQHAPPTVLKVFHSARMGVEMTVQTVVATT